MESIVRLQVCLNLLLASAVAFFEIPIPNMFPGVVHYIVKRVNRFLENGEQVSEPICEEVQSSRNGACDLAEADDESDGESHGSNEDGSVTSGEHQPDGSKNDESP
jgi:hypothetical protein